MSTLSGPSSIAVIIALIWLGFLIHQLATGFIDGHLEPDEKPETDLSSAEDTSASSHSNPPHLVLIEGGNRGVYDQDRDLEWVQLRSQ